jgi:ABC-type multidrug transport system ATPase subunit
MDALFVEGLAKRNGKDVQALDGMSFSVPEDQVFGLLGSNAQASRPPCECS